MARYAATYSGLMPAVRQAIEEASKEDPACREIELVRLYRVKGTDPSSGQWDVELAGGTEEAREIARKYIREVKRGNALVWDSRSRDDAGE